MSRIFFTSHTFTVSFVTSDLHSVINVSNVEMSVDSARLDSSVLCCVGWLQEYTLALAW